MGLDSGKVLQGRHESLHAFCFTPGCSHPLRGRFSGSVLLPCLGTGPDGGGGDRGDSEMNHREYIHSGFRNDTHNQRCLSKTLSSTIWWKKPEGSSMDRHQWPEITIDFSSFHLLPSRVQTWHLSFFLEATASRWRGRMPCFLLSFPFLMFSLEMHVFNFFSP